MEESELEEGEACFYKDDTRIDPDIALSYIDEKLQSVLGHFQKDFEGGVSAENLGTKFGGYGSFLPMYQRSPSIWSETKTPQQVQNYGIPRSPNSLPVEGGPQNSTAPMDAPSTRLGAASCSMHSLHNPKVLSRDFSVKQDSCLSAQVTEKFPLRHKPSSSKSDNPTDQRTLRVRIKVGPDSTARKNAAIYSGLGLISPSSSTGNSLEESGGRLFESPENLDESPASIIQIMTSFPVPGDLLLSPLHDKLLCLIRKGKLSSDSKPAATLKGRQEISSILIHDSTSILGDGKASKGKKTKSVGKSEILEESNLGNETDFKETIIPFLKKNMKSETLESNHCIFNDPTLKSLSNSIHNIGNSSKGALRTPEASREAEKDIPMKKRDLGKDLVKEEPLEPKSGQDGGSSELQDAKSSSVEKIGEHQVRSSHKDISVDIREAGRNKGNRIPSPFKADFDASQYRRDSSIGVMDHLKPKVGPKAASHEQDEMKIPLSMKKCSSEGKKKSKGSQSNGNLASDLVEESLRAGDCAVPKDKKISQKGKVRDSHKDMLDAKLEQMDQLERYSGDRAKQMDLLEKSSGDRAKDSNHETVRERHPFVDKSKERSNFRKVDNHLTSETFLKEIPTGGLSFTKGLSSTMELAPVAHVVIEEDWVGCDRCQKWRLLPYGTKPEQLPEKWLCSMLNWLPGMNRCDISEEVTTNALRALYQLPEGQSNLQNHADRTASGITSANVQYVNQNLQNLSSDAIPNQKKKKHKSKGTPKTASNGGLTQTINFTKNFQQEGFKSRSLNDTNQPLLETQLMEKSNSRHPIKSCNLAVEKYTDKRKGKHMNDAKQKKLKNKRESDQHGHGAMKKIKTEVASDSGKYWTSERGEDLGRVGLSSSTGLPTKAAGKDMQKYNEQNYSKDAACEAKDRLVITVKKQRECTPSLQENVFLDMKVCHEREICVKKKKLKDGQESQNFLESLQSNGDHHPYSKVSVKEESSDNEFMKKKKSRVSRTEGKESSTSKGDNRPNRKGRVTRILLPGGRDDPVNRSAEKDQQPRKHRAKAASQPSSDDVDSLKRVMGTEQFSTAAVSSSSKFSDSRKTRSNFQEVKGSPVESVSSSPMRTSNLDKLSPTRRDGLQKDDAKHCHFPVMGSPRKSLDGDRNFESNQSRVARKGKASDVFHPESSGPSVLDFREGDARQKFGGKAESSVKPIPKFANGHLVNSGAEILERHSPCPTDMCASDYSHGAERMDKNHSNTALFPQKSGKGSTLWSKEDRSSGYNFGRVTKKVGDPLSEQEDSDPKNSQRDEVDSDPHHLALPCEELGNARHHIPDECGSKSIKADKSVGWKASGKCASDNRRENHLKFREHDTSDMKLGALCNTDERITLQQNLAQDFEGKTAEKRDSSQVESGALKSQFNLHHAGKQDPPACVQQPVPCSLKGSGFDKKPVNTFGGGDGSKVLKQPGNVVHQNGVHHSMGYSVPDQNLAKDLSAPSLVKKDASSRTASDPLKVAENLRDYADNLKNSGFGFESNEANFQAALKFLHGASLLETCNSGSSKHGEMSQLQIYSSTAKLCETCAHEYEKCQEMAAAALAYKCMEVACMRVVFCKHSSMNRDRHDLQASLQMAPQGESPSSSASDVDNLNNQVSVEKAVLPKGMASYAGNHIIVPQNRPNFVRLLDFAKDVSSAMEAFSKSHNAFAAAKAILEGAQNKEVITSVKRVIDFSFQDVEELICLVRLAIEAISRQGFSGFRD